jgi:hypothetical protein
MSAYGKDWEDFLRGEAIDPSELEPVPDPQDQPFDPEQLPENPLGMLLGPMVSGNGPGGMGGKGAVIIFTPGQPQNIPPVNYDPLGMGGVFMPGMNPQMPQSCGNFFEEDRHEILKYLAGQEGLGYIARPQENKWSSIIAYSCVTIAAAAIVVALITAAGKLF